MAEPERSNNDRSHDWHNGDALMKVDNGDDAVVGSAAVRPIFLGNLMPDYTCDDITRLFENSSDLSLNRDFRPFYVDHIDQKRGYCFVFMKDAISQSYKNDMEDFVEAINGISIRNVSRAVRVEFARGDGRVKRKEDERRRNIAPCDTLFVVNFSEQDTKKHDLEMLFSPFGELLRIDMRNNYAFVQFRTVEQATKAKEGTDGGRLHQSILTVEFVVRQRDRDIRREPRSSYDDRRYEDRDTRGGGGPRHGALDNYRRRSPPRYDSRDRPRSPYRGRSRSRSPPRRSRHNDYDDYPPRGGGGGGGGSRYAPSPPRRGASPPRRGMSPPRRGMSPPRRGVSPPRGRRSPPYGRAPSPPRRGPSPIISRGGPSPPRDRGASPPRRGYSPPQERYHRGGDRDRGYRGAN